jgi:N-acetylglutamate synthase/N-acetylornithine aminotransferase
MIEPNLATMLGFLTTDAKVEPAVLQQALRASADDTFNAITVDGECSTNDCVFALASGASGVEIDEDLYPALVAGLYEVSRELAIGIVRGGEGATKLITIAVRDARSVADARRVAKTIANSPLVKTAVHGADPNWGRIVAAAGRSGAAFEVDRATVRVGGILLFENGLPHDGNAPAGGRAHETDRRVDRRAAGHRWRRRRHRMDLRSDRRVREDQRRVPHLAAMDTIPPPAARAKDFLSILDLDHAGLERLLALAAR